MQLPAGLRLGPLRVRRGPQTLDLELRELPGCEGELRLVDSEALNAYAQSDGIVLFTARRPT